MNNYSFSSITDKVITIFGFFERKEITKLLNYLKKIDGQKLPSINYLENQTSFHSKQIRVLHRALKASIDKDKIMNTKSLQIGIECYYYQYEKQIELIELIDFVLSGLPEFKGGTNTSAIINDMVAKAKQEIIVFAYTFDAKELIYTFRRALNRGCKIIFLGQEEAILDIDYHLGKHKNKPEFYIFKGMEFYKDRPEIRHVLMHAKTILVDRNDILVTSANLSFSGMRRNVEFGIRLKGKKCLEAYKLISDLLKSGLFKKLIY